MNSPSISPSSDSTEDSTGQVARSAMDTGPDSTSTGPASPTTPDSDLTARTFLGLRWSFFSTAANALLQLGLMAIMARLLDPAAYGLMASAGVVVRFGGYFAQIGVGPALIQKKDLLAEEIRVGFTASLGLGVLVAFLCWCGAPLVLAIIDDAEIIGVVRAMSLSFILTGLSTTALSLLRRNLDFRSLAKLEIASYVVGYAFVGLPLAFQGAGVWSLVAATLTQSAVTAVCSYFYARHSLRPLFSWPAFKPLFSYGSQHSLIGMFEAIAANLDTMIVGRIAGASALGLYNRAFMIVNLPVYYVTMSSTRVLYSSFSRIQDQVQSLKAVYLSTLTLTGNVIIPACFAIGAAAPGIVLAVLGEKWGEAIPVLRILALAAPAAMLVQFSGIVCEATGQLRIKAVIGIPYVGLLAVLFYALAGYGIPGFALALLLGEAVRFVAFTWVVVRMLRIRFRELAGVFGPALVSAVIVGIVVYVESLPGLSMGLPPWLTVSIQAVTALALMLLLFLAPFQKTLRRVVRDRLMRSPGASAGTEKWTWVSRVIERFVAPDRTVTQQDRD